MTFQREAVARGSAAPRHGIVGRSRAIADVIARIELVAATRSTVLITGETGTGKELVARAIHERSAERALTFVKINCAAIPDNLLESELFGHVRGAFTGAVAAKRGKFSLAHRSSIFLDEVGTMGLSLQAKLLRVLQEREIEPLGAERTERVDVRVIAATNRDIRQLVGEGRFQEDLFYRLHVVPIVVPPLRDRPEDIPALAEHFAVKHAARSGKSIDPLDAGVIAALQDHHWPGNVRELEHTIERAVVLSTSPTLSVESVAVQATAADTRPAGVPFFTLRQNLEWMERETIRRALALSTAKKHAATLAGISPRALSYYLAKYPTLEQGEALPNG